MAVSKCNMCNSHRIIKTIQTTLSGSKPVAVAMCRNCDVRRCERCEKNVQNAYARRCSCGNILMGV